MRQWHMGINLGHDRSVAIVRDGEIVVAIEQERLDRSKHSVGLMVQAPDDARQVQVPHECIRYCTDTVGVPLSEMATITANMPGDDLSPTIMRRKFPAHIDSQVRKIPSHHLAHAYTAFWPSGFEEALILVVDASGSTTTAPTGRWTESYSLYRGGPDGVTPIHSERVLAHLAQLSTLGFVYEYVTRKAGFITAVGRGFEYPEAGKLMGLAPYGGPQPSLHSWLRARKDSLSLDIPAYDIFLEIAALEKRYERVGGPRHNRPWLVDLAWKVQNELEGALKHLVSEGMTRTGLARLCLAGGVALNSVANYRVLRDLSVNEIFVFPAAGDNGIAAGCALWAYVTEEGGRQRPRLKQATLGRPFTDAEIEAAVDEFANGIVAERLEPDAIVPTVGEALGRGRVVARFEGASEYGPRALGHRSILADPTFAGMKDVLNAGVKFREAYRPFAPVIPLERANEVFDLSVESPFMLLVADIHPEMQKVVPAITHRDGTGRVQTCTPEENPFLHGLCLDLERRRGGPPVLLNTSFNVAGQPIVEAPEEAIRTFLSTDIDHLSIGPWWLGKQGVPSKDYRDHMHIVRDVAMPAGLPPHSSGVRELMDRLNEALFEGGAPAPWTRAELNALSAEGARWRELSGLFPDSPYVAPLRTMLSDKVVLLLDPLNGATIADGSNPSLASRLSEAEVEMILVLVSPDPTGLVEPLRLQLHLTHAELEEGLRQTIDLLDRYQVPHSGLPIPFVPSEDTVHHLAPAVPTVAAFEDPLTCCRRSLQALRTHLDQVGYTEAQLIDLLGVESLQQIEPTHLRYLDRWSLPESALADLARLFLLRVTLPPERARVALNAQGLDFCLTHGLLAQVNGGYAATVDLFCSGGLRVITDHRYDLREWDSLDEDPVMYIGMDSHGLVQTAPREVCGSVLDLCCGSGIQGLVASRYAERVVGVDINPRAVRFSRFNAQMNGIENYECRLGNLYEPVVGERFDAILANPPFVASPRRDTRYRDGGAAGQDVLIAIIRGAAEHLEAQGRVAIVTDLVDVADYPEKLAKWWTGGRRVALVLQTADRDERLFAVPHVHRPFGQTFAEYETRFDEWVKNFRAAGLSAVNFGYILLWQGETDTTVVRTITNPTRPIHEQVSRWVHQRHLLRDGPHASLHLTLHPDLRIAETRALDGSIERVELSVPGNPFYTTYTVPPLLADALRNIHATRPSLKDRWNEKDATWLNHLLEKAVLLAVAEGDVQQVPSPAVEVEAIFESPTKTTPTCLSSYLR